LLILVAVVGGLALLPSEKQPQFVVFRQPYKFPVPWRDRVGRWLPATPSWAWVWRLDKAVFGRRKAVNLFAAVVAFAHSSSANDSSLSLAAAENQGCHHGADEWSRCWHKAS